MLLIYQFSPFIPYSHCFRSTAFFTPHSSYVYIISLVIPYEIIYMNKTGANYAKNGLKFSVEKMESSYVANLQSLVRLLAEIVSVLCSEDNVDNYTITQLTQLCTEVKYQQKMKNEVDEHSRHLSADIEGAIYSLRKKNEQFPRIKQMKPYSNGELSPIAEKYSQQNLLSNYIRKNSHNRGSKNKNSAELERHSETIHLGSQIFTEETRKSLDSTHNRKPIYSELQRMRSKQPQPSPLKGYNEKKFHIRSKLPNYNISKLI